MESELIEELYGKWISSSRKIEDMRKTAVTSRRRQNLKKALMKASMVVTNNDTLNHLTDYRLVHYFCTV